MEYGSKSMQLRQRQEANDRIQFERMDSAQAKALGLFLEGKSKDSIAKALNVSVRTIWRWMDTLDFRAHLEQAQRSAINMGRTKLTANANKAVQVLVDALDKEKEITKDQVSAATAILDRIGLSAKFQLEYESIEDALKKTFRPEFLNRIDEIIVFEQLTREHILEVVDLMVGEVAGRLVESGVTISLTAEAKAWLGDEGYDYFL